MAAIQSLTATMLTQWQRHALLSNNLANVATPAYKRDDLALTPSSPAATAVAANGRTVPADTQAMFAFTDFSAGPIHQTGRGLDVALDGRGFFAVQTPNGVRYTRAGNFSVSADGYLMTANGQQVLGDAGPIIVGNARATVTPDGVVRDGDRVLGTLRVNDFDDLTRLVKDGGNVYRADAEQTPTAAKGCRTVGGALESANVNPVETMVGMIDLLRTYEAAQRAIQAVDETNRQANDLGRI